jgi:serine/threonine protein kinase
MPTYSSTVFDPAIHYWGFGPLPSTQAWPPEWIGPYKLLGPLGHGGMGEVYRARDPLLDREVALKVPRTVSGVVAPRYTQRIRREGRAAAALDHPNLCPILASGRHGDAPYLVFPLIEGRPLSELVGKGRSWTAGRAATLTRDVALGMAHAHHRGVIHRDLKPANIVVRPDGKPVVLDFGLAKFLVADDGGDLTLPGVSPGTPAYMAPERTFGGRPTPGPAWDVYSLGVVLYVLLTGRRPFKGSAHSVLIQAKSRRPVRPAAFRGVEPRLEAICQRAMHPNAACRYATMDKLAEDLTNYLTPSRTMSLLRRPFVGIGLC